MKAYILKSVGGGGCIGLRGSSAYVTDCTIAPTISYNRDNSLSLVTSLGVLVSESIAPGHSGYSQN